MNKHDLYFDESVVLDERMLKWKIYELCVKCASEIMTGQMLVK